MILMISKYHRTESGETANAVKVEKAEYFECFREAKKQAYQLAANYMADPSVIDWSVSIVNPKTCHIEMAEQYFAPNAPAEEMPEEVVPQ